MKGNKPLAALVIATKDDGDPAMEDAIERFFTAGSKKDWGEANSAYADMCRIHGAGKPAPEEDEDE